MTTNTTTGSTPHLMMNLSLVELRQHYLENSLTPRALITHIHTLIEQDADHNVWLHVLDEDALEPYLEHLDNTPIDSLPLYGIPFAIKDNIDLAGIPTSAACEAFTYTPTQHAHVVDVLIRAGAIPIGKTNLDQFATGLVGTRSPFGQGKNAFNKDYISGGSSAGSALATALGHVSFALGTDTAGSGRVPAVLNNVIGHKPSKGLLSTSGVVPACRTLDCVSIFALTAADAAHVFDIAAHYDVTDAYARPNRYNNRARYFTDTCPETFKFGIPNVLDFQGNTECEALFHNAVDMLTQLGGEAISIDFEPFTHAAKLLYEGPWVAERWLATHDVDPQTMLPEIRTIIGQGNNAKASDAFAAQYRLAELKRQCDTTLSTLDVVLTPTTPTFYTREDIDKDPIRLNSILGTYTNFMNLLDYSATAVPVGKTNCGVHWGVTLFSQAFQDIALLRLSAALQQAAKLPLGASQNMLSAHAQQNIGPQKISSSTNIIDIAVCGAHLSGQPLNWQLTERGATLKASIKSAPHYMLYALPDGKRPAMVRAENSTESTAIAMEVWQIPKENFGSFVANIPAPLGIGKVELENEVWVSGFICDHYGLEGAKNITHHGGWLAWLTTSG